MLGDLGKLIVAKGFKKLPKVQKSPDLVTLVIMAAFDDRKYLAKFYRYASGDLPDLVLPKVT